MTVPLRHAGAARRLFAHIIDGVVIFAGMFVIGVIINVFGLSEMLSGAFFNVMVYALTFAYYAIFIACRSASTPGGMAAGIRVVHSSGARLTLERAYFRTVLHQAIIILPTGWLMAGIPMIDGTIDPNDVNNGALGIVLLLWIFCYIGIWAHREGMTVYDVVASSRVIVAP